MIAVVLLTLGLLWLSSCQLQPEPHERQPDPLQVEKLGTHTGSVLEKPKHLHKAKKTARQYVREGYRLLLVGKERQARRALRAALRQAPNHKQATMFLQHIEADPAAVFGSASLPYRIQPNDTMSGLAQRFLGDPLQFYLLAKYNNLSNPSRIEAGQIIKIPGRPEVSTKPPAKSESALTSLAAAEPMAAPVRPPAVTAALPQTMRSAAPLGRYYALVIGIDAYAHLDPLDTAVTDAVAVSQVLEKRYGFEVIFLPDATRADIVQSLDRLRAILTLQDHLLIYYAGHGKLDEDERGYWLPRDAMPDTRTAWLATADLTETIKDMPARHVMVIADSCYADTQVRNEVDDRPPGEASRQADLKRMDALRSRTVVTSGGLEPVLDRLGGPLSVFANAFLTVLYTNDEVLEGRQLFAEMRPWIIASLSQTPVYADIRDAEHEGGDFLFVPRSPP
jgi:LysM repeat protein